MKPDVEALRTALERIDLDPNRLRDDPAGATWLPEHHRRWCERDAACRDELRRFVAEELALVELVQGPVPAQGLGPDLGRDPFFRARVLEQLPDPLRFMGLSPMRRVALLAVFQLGAVAITYAVVAWLTPELVTMSIDAVHDRFAPRTASGEGTGAGPGWAALTAVLWVAAIAIALRRPHTAAHEPRAR